MLKQVSIALFLLFSFVSSQVFAQQLNLKLNPNSSKMLTNHYSWTLTAKCTVQSNQNKNKVIVSVLKNNGNINGKKLSSGQATSLTVRNNDSIVVTAEPGAQVNLQNLSANILEAACFI